jgi:hypothetical protein
MNVIILTPDRVGSTLLQRLITIYMQVHEFNQPVINLHELTNGLIKYYSDVFNQEVLGKSNSNQWSYYQTLPEVRQMLQSVTHYKTSRMAHYHIKNRKDSIADQLELYQYINDNFFIISAQRDNILEHALSWGIVDHSKRLNVYNPDEKFNVYGSIYKNKITVDPQNLIKHLNNYRDYLDWVNRHFMVNSYFQYDCHLNNIEDYILNLGIFDNQPIKKTWNDTFGIEFKDWNSMHFHVSDLSGINNQIELNNAEVPRLELDPNFKVDVSKFELQPVYNNRDRFESASPVLQHFIQQHVEKYWTAHNHINELVKHKILVTPVPKKLQTFLEKKLLIKNYQECVDVYNEWVVKNNIGKIYQEHELDKMMTDEILNYHVKALLSNT